MDIPTRIRCLRNYRNYSLESMAIELDRSIEGYRKLEFRAARASFGKLQLICEILGVPWKELLDTQIPIQSLLGEDFGQEKGPRKKQEARATKPTM